MHSHLRRAIIGITACVLVATACADAPRVVGPESEVTSDSLRAYLVHLGFRGDMIVDQGDRFVVEGDIQFPKEALRTRMRQVGRFPVAARQPDVRGGVSLEQWSTDLLVTSGFAERIVVNLTGLDNDLPDWATAARQAIQDWNVVTGSWLRFVEGSPADITVTSFTVDHTIAAQASFPLATGKPGASIQVNTAFDVNNNAASRRRNMAHEFGHTVGLRHSNWNCVGPFCQSEQEDPPGANLIPGTPQADNASVMNGGTANVEWAGFSSNDLLAIRTLYPTIGVSVNGTTSIGTAGNYTWSVSTSGGSGQFAYEWVRRNISGYTQPYTIGYGSSVTFYVSAGPSFVLTAYVRGLAGQENFAVRSVNVWIPGSCRFNC